MKRLWILLGAGVFLLCIVTPLYAQMEIKTTGQIRVRYRDWNDFLMDDNIAANPSSPQAIPDRAFLAVDRSQMTDDTRRTFDSARSSAPA